MRTHHSPMWLLAVLGLGLALPACDQECVGPNCEADDDDATDDDDDIGDDDAGDDDTVDGVVPIEQRSCDVTVEHAPGGFPSRVEIAGEWNGWTASPMEDRGDGTWATVIAGLDPGEYGFKFLINGNWEGAPPPSAFAKWVDGNENRNLRVGDCNLPLLQVVETSVDGDGGLRVELLVATPADGAELDPGSVSATVGGQSVIPTVDGNTVIVEASDLPPGKHSVRVWAADDQGRRAENEPAFVPLWVESERWVWADGLMYFAFTDRFRNGDFGNEAFGPVTGVPWEATFQGGDFLGVIQAIEDGYFEDLGVDVIWLSPVYENADGPYLATDGFHQFSGFHGYWPRSHRAIEERWGDAGGSGSQRLHELIEKAHARGIRVLFDLVLNHVHNEHEWMTEHPEWFGAGCVCGSDGCGWEERARDCWFTDYLPDLDYRNHWILRQVVDDTLWLVQEYDVDGLRVDAAKHMDHVIMRTLRKRLERDFGQGGAAPLHMVGETFTGGGGHGDIMRYVSDDELHGQFDFPLYWAIRSAFVGGGSFVDLDAAVSTSEQAYGGAIMSPFLGNHDIPRYATDATGNDQGPWASTPDLMAEGGDDVTRWDLVNKVALGFVFTLTQPGLPLIYYGDEIGLAGSGDPDNRRMMTFDPYLSGNQAEALRRVQDVGRARRGSRALRRGERRTLWVDADLYVYARVLGDDVAIVALNKSDAPRVQSVPLGGLDVDGRTLTDALGSGASVSGSGGSIEVSLGGWQGAIYVD
jgi:glycosidase